ncbi:uncharacterized protein METZ01_LOCUS213668, partial [marine metagenome]
MAHVTNHKTTIEASDVFVVGLLFALTSHSFTALCITRCFYVKGMSLR